MPTLCSVLRCVACVVVLAAPALAQQVPDSARARKPAELFRSEAPFAATLTTNIGRLKRDRVDKAPWRPATLSYAGDSARPVTVPLLARTRGIWRLRKCDIPPLRLDFSRDDRRHTIFRGLDKPKLVNYCRNDDTHEQYLLQELQLYRVYNLLTPVSHRVRLARLTNMRQNITCGWATCQCCQFIAHAIAEYAIARIFSIRLPSTGIHALRIHDFTYIFWKCNLSDQ